MRVLLKLIDIMLVTNMRDMGRWIRTHEMLRKAAWELFSERGYEATSTVQVAERAGVSEMTLFRHFPTKEALLLADPFDPVMADTVRERPRGEPAMRALLEGIREAWTRVDAEEMHALRDVLRLIARTPALHGAVERNSDKTAEALRGALADRGVGEAQAYVAVSAVIAGLSTALLHSAQSESSSFDAALTRALDVLGGE